MVGDTENLADVSGGESVAALRAGRIFDTPPLEGSCLGSFGT